MSNGRKISLKRIQRRMTARGLQSTVTKKYHYYSNNTKVVEQENILQLQQSIKNGWTHIASVIDFYSKKIIGWA